MTNNLNHYSSSKFSCYHTCGGVFELTKIARITTQKKSSHRFNIFIDDGNGEKYGFSVDEEVLIKYNLRKGLSLNETMIEQLLHEDTLQKSYGEVIRFLSYRMRTRKEIIDYLEKKEVNPDHVTKIIDQLTAEKLIDDEEFANAFVRTRIQTTTKGPGLVKQELQQKGVSSSIAECAVAQYDYGIQYEKAKKIIKKRSTKKDRYSVKKQQQQLQATLTRNGFYQDVIQDMLREIQQANDEDELEAISYQGEKLLRKYQGKLSGYELKNKLKEALYRQGFKIESINTYLNEFQIDVLQDKH